MEFANGRALLEDAARGADIPIVLVEMKLNEGFVRLLGQVESGDKLGLAVGDLVDAGRC